MVQAPLKNLQADFRGLLPLNLAHQIVRSLGHLVDEFDFRYSETRASPIGRRSGVGVRRQQDDLIGAEPHPLQFGEDRILKLRSHDHEIEAEDQAALSGAFQQNDGNLDRVEDGRDRSLARRIARQPDRPVSRGHVA